jgi:hypothetical protein
MNASCTFGISIGTGTSRAGNHERAQEQPPSVTSVNNHQQQHHNLIQYDDGLCPYSDEKEVVVEDDNLGQQTIWNSATTSHHNISNEDSRSTETATSSAQNGPHDASASLPKSRIPCTRAWHLTKTAVKNASTSTSKYLTILPHDGSSHAVCDSGLTGITREEFEALPLTIQRKVSAVSVRLIPSPSLSRSCTFWCCMHWYGCEWDDRKTGHKIHITAVCGFESILPQVQRHQANDQVSKSHCVAGGFGVY